jgi:alpha-N-arabinofuranosidase
LVLDVRIESPSTYEVAGMGQIPHLDAIGSFNPDDGRVALFFLNRDLLQAHQVEINWQGASGARSLASWVLTGDDLKAGNSFEAPERVVVRVAEKASSAAGRTTIELPPRSYSVFQWGT